MYIEPTTKVSRLTAYLLKLFDNKDSVLFGLGANQSGRWGLILAEDDNGTRWTLIGTPGTVQTFLQSNMLPDLSSMDKGDMEWSFPRTAKGWPVDWAHDIGIKPPGESPGRVVVSVQTELSQPAWRSRNDWLKVTVVVRIQNPGAADDQTGQMTHHWMQRHELQSFMRGVKAVSGMWSK